MQRLCVAYNFGSRALYNLPWRASVSSHQIQYNISTLEAFLRNMSTCFLNDAESQQHMVGSLCALMQSDCFYSSLFFEHYNRI